MKAPSKGGDAGTKVPKIQALSRWGGGGGGLSDHCLDYLLNFYFILKDLSTCTEGHLSPKSDIFPQKVFLSPQKR